MRDYDVYLAAASETKRTLEKESKHPHSFKLVNRKGDDLRIYYFSAVRLVVLGWGREVVSVWWMAAHRD